LIFINSKKKYSKCLLKQCKESLWVDKDLTQKEEGLIQEQGWDKDQIQEQGQGLIKDHQIELNHDQEAEPEETEAMKWMDMRWIMVEDIQTKAHSSSNNICNRKDKRTKTVNLNLLQIIRTGTKILEITPMEISLKTLRINNK
jgi:hypothetical protein